MFIGPKRANGFLCESIFALLDKTKYFANTTKRNNLIDQSPHVA